MSVDSQQVIPPPSNLSEMSLLQQRRLEELLSEMRFASRLASSSVTVAKRGEKFSLRFGGLGREVELVVDAALLGQM